MFLDAIQQSPGLRTLAPPFPQPPSDADADANALIPSWGRYYRARRRASEHLIHGLTHKPSSSRAGVLLTDFAIGAAIGAVAAVAAVAVIACAIAVVVGLTVDVVSGVVIDAAIRIAVVCMRGGARFAAKFVASLLAGAARVRKGESDSCYCPALEEVMVVLTKYLAFSICLMGQGANNRGHQCRGPHPEHDNGAASELRTTIHLREHTG